MRRALQGPNRGNGQADGRTRTGAGVLGKVNSTGFRWRRTGAPGLVKWVPRGKGFRASGPQDGVGFWSEAPSAEEARGCKYRMSDRVTE